ncbi:hypothetical protein LXL04_022222 [Taraxacum kok-saghyz]
MELVQVQHSWSEVWGYSLMWVKVRVSILTRSTYGDFPKRWWVHVMAEPKGGRGKEIPTWIERNEWQTISGIATYPLYRWRRRRSGETQRQRPPSAKLNGETWPLKILSFSAFDLLFVLLNGYKTCICFIVSFFIPPSSLLSLKIFSTYCQNFLSKL